MSHYRSAPRAAHTYDETCCESRSHEDDEEEADCDDYLSEYEDDFEYSNCQLNYDAYDCINPASGTESGSKNGSRSTTARHGTGTSDACSHASDAAEDNRRDHHNQLERKRRASIKGSYSDLREVIPDLRGSKISRSVILQRAAECIQELTRRNREHTQCVDALTRQNDALDQQIQELHRCCSRIEGGEARGLSFLGLHHGGPPSVFPPVTCLSAGATASIPTTQDSPSTSLYASNETSRGLPTPEEEEEEEEASFSELSYAAEQLQHNAPETAPAPASTSLSSVGFCFTAVLQGDLPPSSPHSSRSGPPAGPCPLSQPALLVTALPLETSQPRPADGPSSHRPAPTAQSPVPAMPLAEATVSAEPISTPTRRFVIVRPQKDDQAT